MGSLGIFSVGELAFFFSFSLAKGLPIQHTLSESALSSVAGVSLAEDGVAVTRDDTAGVESRPEVVGDGLVAEVVANSLLHLGQPVEHLLVGKTVQGTGKTVKTGSQGQEGGAESAADQVSGVGADVAALVVGVDGQVQTQELNKVLVVAESELVGEVEGVVLVLLDGGNLSALEDVLVDAGSNVGQLGNEVHGVLKGVVPVLLLVDASGVGLGERGGVLEGSDGQRELGHGVEVVGAVVDELLDELGDIGAGSPLGGQITDLLLGRDLTGQEKPEEACTPKFDFSSHQLKYSYTNSATVLLTFGEGLLATGSLGEDLLALRDGLSTESDTLLGVEDGTLPDERLDATGTAIDLVEGDLVDNLGTVLPAKRRRNVSDANKLGKKMYVWLPWAQL